MDRVYGLPFTRRPHPGYRARRIPAYEIDEATLDFNWSGDANFVAMDKALRARNLERVAPVPVKSRLMPMR